MLEALRFAASIPLTIGGLIWDWFTRDEFEQFIREQRQRLIDLAEGD